MSSIPEDTGCGLPAEDELDDIDTYIATFNEEEREDLAAAEAAIDFAILLYREREWRG